jgi:hypothetical protein
MACHWSIKMPISEEKRQEITDWATTKALEDAKKANLDRPPRYGIAYLNYDSFVQEKIWHYEKMAYLKIHNRESRMNDERALYKR